MSEPIPPGGADPGGGEVAATERTRLRRLPEQGSHRRPDLYAVLDAGFVCHLGLLLDGWPMVVPTSYARRDDWLFLHGSVASRSLRAAREPIRACVTVTHVDGLVLARSVFEHAVNYRCAMVYGTPEVLEDADQKLGGLRAISDQAAPGQWGYARSPSARELAATTVLRLALDECSVKIRRGPPDDGGGHDAGLDVWAGEIPLRTVRLDPVPDPSLRPGIVVPDHLSRGEPAPGSTPLRDLEAG
ncbi:MAG: pyridoxamine 5'-phosphate oxidase family protein [Acidimicrobiales bacterium]|jgi:nitroimidazol reductase NimA-like FMN-containing flavoprotein (pyridoxamine 5'-phosphate oxidase superfamily)